MKTTAKTIGYNDGLRGTRRQAGRSANGFLSKPCNRFTMPRLWQRIAVGALLALTMSGILPMAVAAFQIWLGDTYGLGLTALCLAADAAVIVWLVARHG